MTLYQLGLEIADEGGWEEFHQRCHNYTLYDHHKARRLKLMAEYKWRTINDLLDHLADHDPLRTLGRITEHHPLLQ